MRKVLIIILFLPLFNVYPESSISIGMVNDNLFNLPDLPLDSILGGPDDKYTFSFFINYYEEDWKILTHYNSITLREANYRYDYLYSLFYYNWQEDIVSYTLGIGLAGIGNFGSEFLQNSLHRMLNFYELELAYIDYNFGLITSGRLAVNFLSLFENTLQLSAFLELELSTTRVPDGLTIALPITYNNDFFMLSLFAGGDMKFSIVQECLSGSSFFYKTFLGFKLADTFILSLGFSSNLIFYCPYFDSFTEYDKHTDSFVENLQFLDAPHFYIGIDVGTIFPKVEDLPLP